MAEPPAYLLAQAYELTAQVPKTTDDRGGPTNRTLAAGWYRTFLALTSGAAGTAVEPKELLTYLSAALGATKWTVRLTAAGFVEIAYTGTGTGEIDLSPCTTLRALLGFTGNIGPLASGAAQIASYLPTHCLFAYVVEGDGAWVETPGRVAAAELPTGRVYAWDDGLNSWHRLAVWSKLPRDWTARTALASGSSPAYGLASRRLDSGNGEPGQTPPWGANDTLATSQGRQCGVCWGTLAALVAGTTDAYELVYMAPATRTAGGRITLARGMEGYDARRDFALELVYAGEAER
jgi:hypothetical protein